MASTSQTTKRSRASVKQINAMLSFFSENPGLADGKYQKLHGKFKYDKKWEEMGEQLNAIGRAVKTVNQWQTVWRDLKSRSYIRYRDRKKTVNQPSVTDLERRVISLIRRSYTIDECPPIVANVITKEEIDIDPEVADETISVAEEGTEMHCDNHNSPSQKTLSRCTKTRRLFEDSDFQNKFLEIAQKQADALKILSDCTLANIKAANSMAAATNLMAAATNSMAAAANSVAAAASSITESIKVMGESLNKCAETIKNRKIEEQTPELLIKVEEDDVRFKYDTT